MKFKNYSINKPSGFVILEVLIAAGLLGIVSYGIVTMLSNASKSQRGIQAKDMQREIMAEISNLLTNKTACLNSFGGGNPIASFTRTDIYDSTSPGPVSKFKTTTKHGSGLLEYREFKVDDWQPGAGYTDKGKANLTIKLTKVGDTLGVKEIEQKIILKLNASNRITECYSTGSSYSGFWNASPANLNDIFYSGGKVGIGTTTPLDSLHLNNIGGGGNYTGMQITNSGVSGRSYGLYVTANGNVIGDGKLGIWDWPSTQYKVVLDGATGNVGIGVDLGAPSSTLEVDGTITAPNLRSPAATSLNLGTQSNIPGAQGSIYFTTPGGTTAEIMPIGGASSTWLRTKPGTISAAAEVQATSVGNIVQSMVLNPNGGNVAHT